MDSLAKAFDRAMLSIYERAFKEDKYQASPGFFKCWTSMAG